MSNLFLPLLFIAGILLGSFMSVLIHRIHTGKGGIFFGRSVCPHCNKTLGAGELVPLVSYVIQGGKCKKCHQKIGWHYPILELSTGLLFVGMAMAGFTPLPLYLIYGLILIFIFFYDLLYLEIPDEVMLPGITLALIGTFHPETVSFLSGFLGALGLFIFFFLQIFISKGRWLGGGDLRIGAFMGFILGWQLSIVAIFLSYVIGAILSLLLIVTGKATRKTMIAFGPFLVFGTLAALFLGQNLIDWYFSLIYL